MTNQTVSAFRETITLSPCHCLWGLWPHVYRYTIAPLVAPVLVLNVTSVMFIGTKVFWQQNPLFDRFPYLRILACKSHLHIRVFVQFVLQLYYDHKDILLQVAD